MHELALEQRRELGVRAQWHVGDITWGLRQHEGREDEWTIRIWKDDGRVVAWSWPKGDRGSPRRATPPSRPSGRTARPSTAWSKRRTAALPPTAWSGLTTRTGWASSSRWAYATSSAAAASAPPSARSRSAAGTRKAAGR